MRAFVCRWNGTEDGLRGGESGKGFIRADVAHHMVGSEWYLSSTVHLAAPS